MLRRKRAKRERPCNITSCLNFIPALAGNLKHHKIGLAVVVIITVTIVSLCSVWMYAALSMLILRDNSIIINDKASFVEQAAAAEPKAQPPLLRLLSVPLQTTSVGGGGGGGVTDTAVAEDVVVVACTVSTDVRGNLGPPSVLLNNGTDWIKDRWQAASDMHGTNIQGEHWVQLEWSFSLSSAAAHAHDAAAQLQQVAIRRIVLDWEAAYSDHYDVQIVRTSPDDTAATTAAATQWQTVLSSPTTTAAKKSSSTFVVAVSQSGQSPGVKTVTPLHVVHDITALLLPPTVALRILIRSSATGWGVSLWQVQVYGHFLQ